MPNYHLSSRRDRFTWTRTDHYSSSTTDPSTSSSSNAHTLTSSDPHTSSTSTSDLDANNTRFFLPPPQSERTVRWGEHTTIPTIENDRLTNITSYPAHEDPEQFIHIHPGDWTHFKWTVYKIFTRPFSILVPYHLWFARHRHYRVQGMIKLSILLAFAGAIAGLSVDLPLGVLWAPLCLYLAGLCEAFITLSGYAYYYPILAFLAYIGLLVDILIVFYSGSGNGALGDALIGLSFAWLVVGPLVCLIMWHHFSWGCRLVELYGANWEKMDLPDNGTSTALTSRRSVSPSSIMADEGFSSVRV